MTEVSLAAALLRSGKLTEASRLLAKRLVDAPGDLDAQHVMARVQIAAGQPGLASLMLGGVEVRRPDDPDVAASLARALAGEGDVEAAGRAAERAVGLAPGSSRSHRAAGYVAAARGDRDGAAAAFARAVERDPSHLGARVSLIGALFVAGRDDAAVSAIVELAERDEDVVPRISYLAVRLAGAGRADQALAALRAGLRVRPGDPELEHLLAAHHGRPPARASDAYVARHFDRFADSFDDTLARLSYETPAVLARLIRERRAGAPHFDRVLDLGCGTGLAADLLRPMSGRLVGVDLSPGMLQRARLRGVYDELHVAEAGRWCEEHPRQHDLIYAADVLIYFGELQPILVAVGQALCPGGLFAASFERRADPGAHLAGHGRWAHDEGTVRSAGVAAGLELVELRETVLREEAGESVAGLLALWRAG